MRTEIIGDATLILGDCREAMSDMIAAGVQYDACVTDPPYELTGSARSAAGFMNKAWDGTGVAFDVDMWRQVYDLLKPGAHLAAFGGTRTSHRMVCAIEDAGFEIRDNISYLSDGGLSGPLLWCFGTGFPKSHAVEALPGWGSALKPCHEPIVLARKPLIGTIAQNVLAHGTGAINIDACRVPGENRPLMARNGKQSGVIWSHKGSTSAIGSTDLGRWPGNLLHDGSPEVLDAFAAFGQLKSNSCNAGLYSLGGSETVYGKRRVGIVPALQGSSGTAARFFYSAKAAQSERWTHCAQCAVSYPARGDALHVEHGPQTGHPTVKPLSLMRWLVTLITPPGGRVLDPFAGTGSTLVAAREAGFIPSGIEKEPDYFATISERLRRQSDSRVKAQSEIGLTTPDLFAALS